ncbi:MAG: caspase family protein [Thermoguttaceae bacterium]|nr:caspase family protein [Thermoguttaceae bacterium]
MRFVASLRWLSVLGLACWAALSATATARAQGNAAAKKYAIVIGASYFEDRTVCALPFVDNDASLIVETLADCGFTVYPFCEKRVKFDAKNEKIKASQLPTKENVERAFADKNGPLRNVFKNRRATLLVYFSGHGLQAPERENGTRLFLRDSYRDELTETTLSAQALRKMMSATGCANRLLLLDACHAGGTRGREDDKGPTYVELFEKEFLEGGLAGTPTFASCDFVSVSGALMPWVERFDASQKKRDVSVFTYWINEGFKGYADGAVDQADADGVIGSDELFAYVAQNLEWMRSVKGHWQTPTLVASKNDKPFALCAAPRRDYWEAIDDLAEQVVTRTKIWGKEEIYVEKFAETFASPTMKRDRDEVDALHSFAVSATERLRESARQKWKALNNESTMRGDYRPPADKRVVVKSVVEARIGDRGETTYAMTCNVREPSDAASRELAVVRGSLRKKDAAEMKLKSVGAGDANAAPFVRIEAKGPNDAVWETRAIREIDGLRWVELNPGETYRVVLEPTLALIPAAERANGVAEKVCARLLVDGRNSLPQYEPYAEPTNDFFWQTDDERNRRKVETRAEAGVALDAAVEETSETAATLAEPSTVVAPVVPLDEARFWLLDAGQTYPIEGFYDPSLQSCSAFCVESAASSEDENGVDESERGLIVVAFYKATRSRSARPDVQTKPGPKKKCSAFVVKGWEIGANLAFLRLRCASANYLEELEKATEYAGARGDE